MLKHPLVTAVLLQIFLQFLSAGALAQTGFVDGMRGATPIADESKPPPLGTPENKDVRRERTYTMQPPTIPHKIDNYQVDKNVNMCLTCHSRGRAASTQAVAVSVSHYMDRDGNFLAGVSARRYFCGPDLSLAAGTARRGRVCPGADRAGRERCRERRSALPRAGDRS